MYMPNGILPSRVFFAKIVYCANIYHLCFALFSFIFNQLVSWIKKKAAAFSYSSSMLPYASANGSISISGIIAVFVSMN